MITTTILIFLGGLLALVLWTMMRGGKTQPANAEAPQAAVRPISGPTGANVDLTQAQPGDVVSIPGAAADFSDVDFTIDRRSAYESMNRRWIDLSGESRGNRVYLEVQPGNESDVVGIVDPRRLTLPDLSVTEEQMADLDSRQDAAQFVNFEGKRWQYESSREVGYFENETGAGEGLYRWTFRETGGNKVLIVEKWEGEPFEGRVAQRLNPRDITVFRAA